MFNKRLAIGFILGLLTCWCIEKAIDTVIEKDRQTMGYVGCVDTLHHQNPDLSFDDVHNFCGQQYK